MTDGQFKIAPRIRLLITVGELKGEIPVLVRLKREPTHDELSQLERAGFKLTLQPSAIYARLHTGTNVVTGRIDVDRLQAIQELPFVTYIESASGPHPE